MIAALIKTKAITAKTTITIIFITLFFPKISPPIFLHNKACKFREPIDQYSGQYFLSLYHTIQMVATNIGQKMDGMIMEQKIRRDLNMGDNLRRLRFNSGLSQEKLCAELQRRGCDIGRTTYAKYEAGELNIKASVIVTLRKIYSCSYDDFFQGLD